MTLTGNIDLSNGESFPYKIVLTEYANGVVKGHSITFKEPNETKATISGIIDHRKRTLIFKETQIVFSHGFPTKAFMCLIDANLDYVKIGKENVLKGTITNKEADETTCTGGFLIFRHDAELQNLFGTHEKFDTVISMGKKSNDPADPKKVKDAVPDSRPGKDVAGTTKSVKGTTADTRPGAVTTGTDRTKSEIKDGKKTTPSDASASADVRRFTPSADSKLISESVEPRRTNPLLNGNIVNEANQQLVAGTDKITAGIEKMYNWHSDTVIIELWDGGNIDGDRVSLLFNGMQYLNNYFLVKEKRQLIIPLSVDQYNIITIIAENEGDDPPTTASLYLKDGLIKYSLLAYNAKGQQAVIKLKRW